MYIPLILNDHSLQLHNQLKNTVLLATSNMKHKIPSVCNTFSSRFVCDFSKEMWLVSLAIF